MKTLISSIRQMIYHLNSCASFSLQKEQHILDKDYIQVFIQDIRQYLDDKVGEDRNERHEDTEVDNPKNIRHPIYLESALYLFCGWATGI